MKSHHLLQHKQSFSQKIYLNNHIELTTTLLLLNFTMKIDTPFVLEIALTIKKLSYAEFPRKNDVLTTNLNFGILTDE